MCGICGCSDHEDIKHEHEHHHFNASNLLSTHDHPGDSHLIHIQKDIFAKNDQFALANHNYFLTKKILALNLMSSPGSGKTTLLVKTIIDMKQRFTMAAIEGDQQTNLDAKRIEAAGANVVQINTGRNCHLDAHMVGHAAETLSMHSGILFIENVGNLVCPALFNLGESFKIVILSVTEGDDKPLKYPDMFRTANLLILNKIDLLPFVEFDIFKFEKYVRQINPQVQVLQLSAKNGNGLDSWYQWLELQHNSIQKVASYPQISP